MASHREYSAGQFTLYEELGRGSFGVVYRGIDNLTGNIVAVKQIDLESSDDDIEEIQKEIAILRTCRHPNITKYYGCFVKGYKLWIIMECLSGGSCLDLLQSGSIDESGIAIICKGLVQALIYLHENGKIHRDIKAANVLLSSKGEVKVGDFGVATQLSNNLSRRNTFVGTPFWMSPEVILQETYNYKADIWSLGITAMELALGKPPLSNIHPMKVLFLIPESDPPRLPRNKYSAEFCDFVSSCLQKNPHNRLSAKKLISHPFITNAGGISRMKQIIEKNKSHGPSSTPKKMYVPTVQSKDESLDSINTSQIDWDLGTVKTKTIKSSTIRNEKNIKEPETIQLNKIDKVFQENLQTFKNNNRVKFNNTVTEFRSSSKVGSSPLKNHDHEHTHDIFISEQLNKVMVQSIEQFKRESDLSRAINEDELLNKLNDFMKLFEEMDPMILLDLFKITIQNVKRDPILFPKLIQTDENNSIGLERQVNTRNRDRVEELLLSRWVQGMKLNKK